jgi:hypothetical protein
MRTWIAALTLLAVTSAKASAADVVSEFQNRPTAVFAQFGLGTPLGFAGVEAEQMVTQDYAVSAGIGYGTGGPQAAVMIRLLAGGDRSKFVIGAGASGGRYIWQEFCFDDDGCARKSGTVGWGNVEMGGEHRFRSGFAFKYFAGYGRLLAGSFTCDDEPNRNHCETSHQDDGYNLVYTGIAMGYAF